MSFALIVAMEKNRGIGFQGRLPWPRLKGDMAFFKDTTLGDNLREVMSRYQMITAFPDKRVLEFDKLTETLGLKNDPIMANPEKPNTVIMGHNTWNSLPEKFRPLPQRMNMVLTRDPKNPIAGSHFQTDSLNEAIDSAQNNKGFIYVIGGGQIYLEALKHPQCQYIIITQIFSEFPCDTFFPELSADFQLITRSPHIRENDLEYCFQLLERKS